MGSIEFFGGLKKGLPCGNVWELGGFLKQQEETPASEPKLMGRFRGFDPKQYK